MKTKVLFVAYSLVGGGAEKVLIDILNHINYEKFDITLFVLVKEGVYLDQINSQVKVKYLDHFSNKLSIKAFHFVLKKFPNFIYRYYIKKEEFDVEIAFLEGWPTKLLAHSNNKKSKKIAWVHIDLYRCHITKDIFKEYEELECYNKFNDIVFVSNDAKEAFNMLFSCRNSNTKQHIIYNPIITDEIVNKSEDYIINYNEPTVVTVGRLNSQKGYDRLIKAHAKLVKSYPHKIVIIGEGEERKILEKLIDNENVNGTVELKGYISNPYPYIKAADVYISSSRAEGFSLVIAEAITLEKAIIATKCAGPRELLDDGKYGLICDDSEEGIKEALETLLKDKTKIKYFEKQSKKRKQYLNYIERIKDIELLLEF